MTPIGDSSSSNVAIVNAPDIGFIGFALYSLIFVANSKLVCIIIIIISISLSILQMRSESGL